MHREAPIRFASTVAIGAAVLIVLQLLIMQGLPLVGAPHALATIMLLSVFESRGFAVLRDANEAWPLPTELGLYVAVAVWWSLWCLALGVWWWLRLPSRPSTSELVTDALLFLFWFFIVAVPVTVLAVFLIG